MLHAAFMTDISRKKVANALSWTVSSSFLTHGIMFFRSVVLARLLAPADFGLFGMATLALSTLSVFTELGLAAAIIPTPFKDETDKKLFLNTIWTVDLFRKTLTTFVLLLVSYPVARYFGHRDLLPILWAVSFSPMILGLTNLGMTLLRKEISFKKLVVQEQIANILSTIIILALALTTRNVWALVMGHLAGNALGALLSYFFHDYRPHFAFDRESFKKGFQFGKHMWVIAILTFVTTQFDNLIIGRYLGAAVLGVYLLAYRLASLPVDFISSVFSSVMFPAYAALNTKRDGRLAKIFLKAANGAALILLAIILPMKIFAAEFIHFLYGSKWAEAIPLLEVLAWIGLFRGMALTISPVLAGLNRLDLDAAVKMGEALIFIPGVIYGVKQFGVIGAAWAGVVSYFFAYAMRLFLALKIILPKNRPYIFFQLLKPVLAAAIAFAVASFLKNSGSSFGFVLIAFEFVLFSFVLILDASLRHEFNVWTKHIFPRIAVR